MVIFTIQNAQVRFTCPSGGADWFVVTAATADGSSLDISDDCNDDAEEESWIRDRVRRALEEGGRPIPYDEYRARRFGR